jgi:hypothetical protein
VPQRTDIVPEDSVREALRRILASEEFHASKRSCEFLTYVVENTLQGHGESLKERTIGIDVFRRSANYDPGEDATVRVKAGEVRKRLSLYYGGQGKNEPIRIEIPSGSYVPEFRLIGEEPITGTAEAKPPRRIRPGRRTALVVALAAIISLVISVALIWMGTRSATPLDEFWAPVLSGAAPVSLCVAWVPVYGIDREPTQAQPAKPEEFTLLRDQFVGGGDLIATSRISAMMTRRKRPFFLRVGNAVSFEDLRTSPAILIGYSYTFWKEISSQMRYFIDTSKTPIGITDNGAPTKWSLPDLPRDRKTDRDYAIVSRVFHPDTHAMLVEIAGITQYGTEAASDLVTNPDLLAEALRHAPDGWQKKNMQLVLYSRVIEGAPAAPQIVASYFW